MKKSSPYPDIYTSTSLKPPQPKYTPSYLAGIDLALNRSGQPASRTPNSAHELRAYNVKHEALEAFPFTGSVEEYSRLAKISKLAKHRTAIGRQVAKEVIERNYEKEYKYTKEEMDARLPKKFFSYFYPNRESLEDRYNR